MSKETRVPLIDICIKYRNGSSLLTLTISVAHSCAMEKFTSSRLQHLFVTVYRTTNSVYCINIHTSQGPIVDSSRSLVWQTIMLLPAVPFRRAHLLGLAGCVADKLNPIDGAQSKDKRKTWISPKYWMTSDESLICFLRAFIIFYSIVNL